MKRIALILFTRSNSHIKEICFDRPKCLLSVCGQTLIRRIISQFWDYADKFYIASGGDNIMKIKNELPFIDKIHFLSFNEKEIYRSGKILQYALLEIQTVEDKDYSLLVIDGDLVITDLAINKFIENKSPLKFMYVDGIISEHDDKIMSAPQGFYFTKEQQDNWVMLDKCIGIIELSFSVVENMLHDNEIPKQYVEWIARYTNSTFTPIQVINKDAVKISTDKDYSAILHNYNIRPVKDVFDPYRIHFGQELQIFVGVYDVIGAKIARQMGIGGLYLGSYQISAATGKKDTEDFSIKESLKIASNIRYAGIEMPIIIDAMSGFQNLGDLKEISKQVSDLKIGGFCVDDLSSNHKCSMNEDFAPSLLSLDKYKKKIDTLRMYLPDTCKIIARTEILHITKDLATIRHRLTEIDSMGADILLPHYVNQNIHFLEEVLKETSFKTPLMIIPSRLLNIDKLHWKELGYEYIIYANVDIRLRTEKLEQLYEELTIKNSISEEMLEPNSLFHMYDFG